MDLSKYKLIIFDLDGTLADRDSNELLEGVADWFGIYRHNTNGKKLAIATNQGGIGLRFWMEKDGFGEPEKYPTEKDFWERMSNLIIHSLGISPTEIPVYASFRYQSTKGNWSPIPDGQESNEKWKATSRKPSNGMLVYAMLDADIHESQTLMVGDSTDDERAAKAAGCDFMWAWEFFGRDKP